MRHVYDINGVFSFTVCEENQVFSQFVIVSLSVSYARSLSDSYTVR